MSDKNRHVRHLSSILTPGLLSSFLQVRLPFDKSGSLDFGEVWTKKGGSFDSAEVQSASWSALVALSKIPLSEMPDMMDFLPPPNQSSFPEQCLGLTLLLDQGPRLLCRGIDGRWVDAFFAVITQRLVHSWLALPAEQRPNSWDRWRDGGASFDYWVMVHFWFSAPFVHSESMDDQDTALAITEERRKLVEETSGETDPYRVKRSEVLSDATAFPRVAIAGPPTGEGVTMQQFAFWAGMLMDVHWPIIKTFGRYPYRNAIQGRETTDEESNWLDETDHFGEASPEVAEKVREDVTAGRWTPLSEELPV